METLFSLPYCSFLRMRVRSRFKDTLKPDFKQYYWGLCKRKQCKRRALHTAIKWLLLSQSMWRTYFGQSFRAGGHHCLWRCKLFTVPMCIQNGISLIHFSTHVGVLKHGHKFPGTLLIEKWSLMSLAFKIQMTASTKRIEQKSVFVTFKARL